MLADGKPLTAEALANATGIEASEVRVLVEAAQESGIEVEDGAVVGAALTLRPARYRFRVRGNDLYAWCGFDAMFLPMIIGDPAEVVAACDWPGDLAPPRPAGTSWPRLAGSPRRTVSARRWSRRCACR